MGDLARQRAGNRLRQAIHQRAQEDGTDFEVICQQLASALQRRAFDSEEVHKTACEIAVNPDTIDGLENVTHK